MYCQILILLESEQDWFLYLTIIQLSTSSTVISMHVITFTLNIPQWPMPPRLFSSPFLSSSRLPGLSSPAGGNVRVCGSWVQSVIFGCGGGPQLSLRLQASAAQPQSCHMKNCWVWARLLLPLCVCVCVSVHLQNPISRIVHFLKIKYELKSVAWKLVLRFVLEVITHTKKTKIVCVHWQIIL